MNNDSVYHMVVPLYTSPVIDANSFLNIFTSLDVTQLHILAGLMSVK